MLRVGQLLSPEIDDDALAAARTLERVDARLQSVRLRSSGAIFATRTSLRMMLTRWGVDVVHAVGDVAMCVGLASGLRVVYTPGRSLADGRSVISSIEAAALRMFRSRVRVVTATHTLASHYRREIAGLDVRVIRPLLPEASVWPSTDFDHAKHLFMPGEPRRASGHYHGAEVAGVLRFVDRGWHFRLRAGKGLPRVMHLLNSHGSGAMVHVDPREQLLEAEGGLGLIAARQLGTIVPIATSLRGRHPCIAADTAVLREVPRECFAAVEPLRVKLLARRLLTIAADRTAAPAAAKAWVAKEFDEARSISHWTEALHHD